MLYFGEVYNDENINDESRFIEQENTIGLTSDLTNLEKLIFIIHSLIGQIISKFMIKKILVKLLMNKLDQSNISINWLKKLNKYSFEFNLNKSSKDDFKSDYMSLNIKGKPIKNIEFELSSSLIEKVSKF